MSKKKQSPAIFMTGESVMAMPGPGALAVADTLDREVARTIVSDALHRVNDLFAALVIAGVIPVDKVEAAIAAFMTPIHVEDRQLARAELQEAIDRAQP